MDEVNSVKEDKQAGDKITLTVYRISTGQMLNITVTLMDAHDLEGDDPAAESSQSTQDNSSGGYQDTFPVLWLVKQKNSWQKAGFPSGKLPFFRGCILIFTVERFDNAEDLAACAGQSGDRRDFPA